MVRRIIVIGLLGVGFASGLNAMEDWTAKINFNTNVTTGALTDKENIPTNIENQLIILANKILQKLINLEHDEGHSKNCPCCRNIAYALEHRMYTLIFQYLIQKPRAIAELYEHNPELWKKFITKLRSTQINKLRIISNNYELIQRRNEGYQPPPLVLRGDHTW